MAFYLMDQWWYHPLLRGAVAQAIALEDQLAYQVPGIGLTSAIREASHTKLLGKERDSAWKMRWFYRLIGGVLVLILFGIIVTPVGETSDTQPSPAQITPSAATAP